MPLIERYFLIHRIISLPMQYFVLGISYEVSLFTYIEKLDKSTVEKKGLEQQQYLSIPGHKTRDSNELNAHGYSRLEEPFEET